MFRMQRRRRGGFTLMEVLLVLVILVILGSMAGIFIRSARKKANIDALKVYPDDSYFNLFARIRAGVQQQGEELGKNKESVDGVYKQVLEE